MLRWKRCVQSAEKVYFEESVIVATIIFLPAVSPRARKSCLFALREVLLVTVIRLFICNMRRVIDNTPTRGYCARAWRIFWRVQFFRRALFPVCSALLELFSLAPSSASPRRSFPTSQCSLPTHHSRSSGRIESIRLRIKSINAELRIIASNYCISYLYLVLSLCNYFENKSNSHFASNIRLVNLVKTITLN